MAVIRQTKYTAAGFNYNWLIPGGNSQIPADVIADLFIVSSSLEVKSVFIRSLEVKEDGMYLSLEVTGDDKIIAFITAEAKEDFELMTCTVNYTNSAYEGYITDVCIVTGSLSTVTKLEGLSCQINPCLINYSINRNAERTVLRIKEAGQADKEIILEEAENILLDPNITVSFSSGTLYLNKSTYAAMAANEVPVENKKDFNTFITSINGVRPVNNKLTLTISAPGIYSSKTGSVINIGISGYSNPPNQISTVFNDDPLDVFIMPRLNNGDCDKKPLNDCYRLVQNGGTSYIERRSSQLKWLIDGSGNVKDRHYGIAGRTLFQE